MGRAYVGVKACKACDEAVQLHISEDEVQLPKRSS